MIRPGDIYVRTVTTQTPASATSIVVIEVVRQSKRGSTEWKWWKCYHIGSGNFIHLEDYYIGGHYRKVA